MHIARAYIQSSFRFDNDPSCIFEDIIEEFVDYDAIHKLHKFKPDRLIGFKQTKVFQNLLDQPLNHQSERRLPRLRDVVHRSASQSRLNSCLFPFLILEAKSDSSSASFSDIQIQTSFPIRSLLNLQRDLASRCHQSDETPEPLIWFLAYKGSDWKVYGCYTSHIPNSAPVYVGI